MKNTMKFINKWYLVLMILVVVTTFFYISSHPKICTEPFIDEEKLMRDCNVTPEEYTQQIIMNDTFCPEGRASFTGGGCYPDLNDKIVLVVLVLIIYNLLYTTVYLILRKKKS